MSTQNDSQNAAAISTPRISHSDARGKSVTTDPTDILPLESQNVLSLLQDSIRYFLTRDLPVYLDGFGILFPRIRAIDRSYQQDAQLIVRKEFVRTVEFEKCSNLSQFHRDTYGGLIELKELSQRVYAFMPVHRSIHVSEKDVRGELAYLIERLVYQTVAEGSSNFFSALGRFYALHNRQGNEFKDWFAGSDIFLQSYFSEPTSVGRPLVRERPILESSWELLQAAYGAPLAIHEVNLAKELGALGYDVAELPNDIERKIPVAIFQAYASREKTHYLIYCTDGLRKQGLRSKRSKGFGTEMVLQLPISSELAAGNKEHLGEIPLWPLRPITMGWILLQSTASKTLRPDLKMTEGVTLIPDFDSDLSSIFCSAFASVKEEQLSSEGPFYYTNIIGITQDEFQFAERNGADQLRTILEYKKLLQFTKPLRSSLTARSSFEEKQKKAASPYILHDPRIHKALEGTRSSVPA